MQNPHPLAYAAKKLKKVVGMDDDESTAATPQVGRKAGDGWPPLVNKAKKVVKDVMTADTQYGKIRKAQLAAPAPAQPKRTPGAATKGYAVPTTTKLSDWYAGEQKHENIVATRKRKQKEEAERIVRGQPGRTKATDTD
jgi:hypothetical protein